MHLYFRNVLYTYSTKRHSCKLKLCISTPYKYFLPTNLNKKCKNVYVIRTVTR